MRKHLKKNKNRNKKDGSLCRIIILSPTPPISPGKVEGFRASIHTWRRTNSEMHAFIIRKENDADKSLYRWRRKSLTS